MRIHGVTEPPEAENGGMMPVTVALDTFLLVVLGAEREMDIWLTLPMPKVITWMCVCVCIYDLCVCVRIYIQ